MASRTLKTRVILALVSLVSLLGVYWFVFTGKASDEFSPEEINDLFQNKKSEVSVKRVELHDHAIVTPYLNKQTLKSETWDLTGDIIVENDRRISLTSDGKHQAGNMFSKKPLEAESFEMELTFHIHSQSAIKADGMAVWFTAEPLPLGDVFGAQNNFKGLGIMLDTFKNGRRGDFPLITAQYSPSVIFYDKHTDGMNTMMASCTATLIMNPSSGKTRMRIVHTKNGYLSVDFNYDPENTNEWFNCFSVTGVVLPEKPYIGISAETGELHQNVDIIESKIFALYTPDGDHFIESIDELESIMEQQAPAEEKEAVPEKQRTRKSVLRLRNAERRLKERERSYRLEKYGDADATFVKRWKDRALAMAKYMLYVVLFLFVLWILRLVMKSRKGNRGYRSTGLLD